MKHIICSISIIVCFCLCLEIPLKHILLVVVPKMCFKILKTKNEQLHESTEAITIMVIITILL